MGEMGEMDREMKRCLRQIAQYVDVVGTKKCCSALQIQKARLPELTICIGEVSALR